MPSAVEQQRAVATLILTVISGDDFALAGSGALREHGLLDRPTQDVDVFTIDAATERFQGRWSGRPPSSSSTAIRLCLSGVLPSSLGWR